MYQSKVRIHFDECDPAGILFYGHIFHLSHRQIELFLEKQGIAWKDWFDHPEWAVPIRHAEAQYLKPLRAGETYLCEVIIQHLGNSSVQIETIFKDQRDHECARVTSSHVFLDKSTGQKRAIPEGLRKFL